MKKTLVITDRAKRDLREIRAHIQKDSPHDAQVFAEKLAATIEWIAEVDFSGSPRNHIREGLRGFPYRKRCIYFRSYPDRLVIVRVLHGAQDVTQQDFGERLLPQAQIITAVRLSQIHPTWCPADLPCESACFVARRSLRYNCISRCRESG